MKKTYLMGIDIGTSSAKTIIITKSGDLIGKGASEYSISTPHPKWAEQDPEIWWRAVVKATKTALKEAQIAGDQIGGVGLSGQMHGLVCLGKDGIPSRPAIIWADQRSQEQVDQINTRIGQEQLSAWTGTPVFTGFMLASWLWLQQNEPDIFEKTTVLLLPKDYLRFQLTGKIGSEPSDASSTGMFNPFDNGWCLPLLNAFSLDPKYLPSIHPSHTIAGNLTEKAAKALSLQAGTPVIMGGSDQTMQAIGNGIITPGMISSTIGTGGQLLAPVQIPGVDPNLRLHLFCHAWPKLWILEGATLSAGLTLKWLRDGFLDQMSYQEMADLASTIPAGAEDLIFLPYLAGERTPIMDPKAKATFHGLTLRHKKSHMIRAVMEGVVLGLKQGLDLMIDLGTPIERIVASGGASQHPLWRQIQADCYNTPLYRTQTIEAAGVGAALLAGVGCGLYPNLSEACKTAVKWHPEITYPIAENVEIYQHSLTRMKTLYQSVRSI
jgi:xylulokinase